MLRGEPRRLPHVSVERVAGHDGFVELQCDAHHADIHRAVRVGKVLRWVAAARWVDRVDGDRDSRRAAVATGGLAVAAAADVAAAVGAAAADLTAAADGAARRLLLGLLL